MGRGERTVRVEQLVDDLVSSARRAGTGTARWSDVEWDAEAAFDVSTGARRIVDLLGGGTTLIVDGVEYRSWEGIEGFWDRVPSTSGCGDLVTLIRSLPPGEATVVEESDRATVYELDADESALADFCGLPLAHSDAFDLDPRRRTRLSTDASGRLTSIRTVEHSGTTFWDTIFVSEWGRAADLTPPPPEPDWAMDRPPTQGERQLQTFAVRLSAMLASDSWTVAAWVEAWYPEEPGSRSKRGERHLWLIRPIAEDTTEAVMVGSNAWVARRTEPVTRTETYLDMLATHPSDTGEREANFLIVFLDRRAGDQVLLTSTWSHHPAVVDLEAARQLADPTWVDAALRTAGADVP